MNAQHVGLRLVWSRLIMLVVAAIGMMALAGCGSVEATSTPIAVAPTTTSTSAQGIVPEAQTTYVPPTALVGTPRPGAVATLTAAPKLKTGTLTILNADGQEVNIHVEVADTELAREIGLMHRTTMDVDAGMLFDFGGDSTGGFWMQNTLLPLSIAFIAGDGTILNIEDMQPLDTNTTGAAGTYQFALEANQGWYRARNIVPGGKVLLPVVLDSAEAPPLPGMPSCPATERAGVSE